jgi:hypothetical protein
MKKIAILTIVCLCFLSEALAISRPKDEPNKLVLSCFLLKDEKIGHLTSDISNFVFRRKNGYLWPVTKILFSKDKEALKLDITALDNEWNKLHEPGEKTYGYFVMNNRIFIMSTKEGDEFDFSEYFYSEPEENSERTFGCTDSKKVIKNPRWVYIIEPGGTFPKQLQSANIEALGK